MYVVGPEQSVNRSISHLPMNSSLSMFLFHCVEKARGDEEVVGGLKVRGMEEGRGFHHFEG